MARITASELLRQGQFRGAGLTIDKSLQKKGRTIHVTG